MIQYQARTEEKWYETSAKVAILRLAGSPPPSQRRIYLRLIGWLPRASQYHQLLQRSRMTFFVRPLEPQKNLGEELRRLRRQKILSLDMVAKATKITRACLRAMEEGAWQDLPAPVYTRNFLRSYAQYLGADVPYVLSRFQKERACCDFLGKCQIPLQRIRRNHLFVPTRILRFSALGVIFLALLGYLGWQVRGVIEPPKIVVFAPTNGMNALVATVEVTGQTEKAAQLFVNHQPVLPDTTGAFNTNITLERGLNVIEIEGKKRYSRTAIIRRTVVFEPTSLSERSTSENQL